MAHKTDADGIEVLPAAVKLQLIGLGVVSDESFVGEQGDPIEITGECCHSF
jgi:hypothetical protein